MPLILLNRDITTISADAIVNAANTDLVMGGGVCGAIFRAAGAERLAAACEPLAPIAAGAAVITPGFRLPAKYIIHTAGPIYRREQAEQCRALLRSCYLNSLALAMRSGCESIAFPLISAGIYGYPREEAIRVAEDSIREFLTTNDLLVYLLVLDKGHGLVEAGLKERIQNYLDSLLPSAEPDHFVLNALRDEASPCNIADAASAPAAKGKSRRSILPKLSFPSSGAARPPASAAPTAEADSLESLVGNLDESFSQTLLKLIDAKGRTDVDVYKRANLDRKLFSKIRTGKGYMPSKRTALALAVSLELDLWETRDLLARAGYALSHSQKFDVIVEYFILNGIYDIFLINDALFQYDQPLLGG